MRMGFRSVHPSDDCREQRVKKDSIIVAEAKRILGLCGELLDPEEFVKVDPNGHPKRKTFPQPTTAHVSLLCFARSSRAL